MTAPVTDPDGNALTVTWNVDGGPAEEVDVIPAGGPPTVASPTFTHTYSEGVHTVTITVSDGLASVSCQTTVTVVDTTAPVISCPTGTDSLWPPNHNLVNVGLAVSAVDACDANPSVSVRVYSDEDDEDQTGDGHHSPDAKDIASGTLRLRSERKGDADGRVYLIIVTATDHAGNDSRCCHTVVVPHSQSKAAIASVNAQAAAAAAHCAQFGTPPPGYFVVGDGPIIGPKQ
ncbi:MAG: PKD domain-containing protein [Acidobacteria bacterium]|nr:PKD domain-containing protein [Acidobacteriota bacterium]